MTPDPARVKRAQQVAYDCRSTSHHLNHDLTNRLIGVVACPTCIAAFAEAEVAAREQAVRSDPVIAEAFGLREVVEQLEKELDAVEARVASLRELLLNPLILCLALPEDCSRDSADAPCRLHTRAAEYLAALAEPRAGGE